ncbi:unnamed protein product, partial [marine sediment metagenome]
SIYPNVNIFPNKPAVNRIAVFKNPDGTESAYPAFIPGEIFMPASW